jgi:hypothetical protein
VDSEAAADLEVVEVGLGESKDQPKQYNFL